MEITETYMPRRAPRLFTTAAACLKDVWHFAVRRMRSPRKTLAVRETTALGDRRFVSVIQFERQRFLVGSSPSSVTLLARLPDDTQIEDSRGDGGKKESGERH